MSRKKGHGRKRKKKARLTRGGTEQEMLLASLAACLNRCEKAGIKVHHPQVGVLTSHGAIMPLKGGWAARPFR